MRSRPSEQFSVSFRMQRYGLRKLNEAKVCFRRAVSACPPTAWTYINMFGE